jgi:hypothetical protein
MRRTLTLVPRSRLPRECTVEQDGLVMVLTPTPDGRSYRVRIASRRERWKWRLVAPLKYSYAWIVLKLSRGPVRDLLVAAREEDERWNRIGH